MQSLLILGRQPELGMAELESLYGEDKLTPAADGSIVLVNVDPCLLAYDRLGGSTKFCMVLTTLDSTDWPEIEKFLINVAPDQSLKMPEGKMHLGMSLTGFGLSPAAINASGFKIKKAIQKTGRSVRYVPNKSATLSTAQVLHNKLTGANGWELVIIKDSKKTIIAQTVKVQDIEGYTKRDQERPKRDAKVGMLPPKLAQIMINLSVGLLPDEARQSICEIPPDQPIPIKHLDQTVLDPFCGTGVVLQEALLMGYNVYGTDIDERMINYTEFNINDWLLSQKPDIKSSIIIEQGDAMRAKWQAPINFVACETYLGRPFSMTPSPETLRTVSNECNLIIKDFLKNLATQIEANTRLCVAIPAWQNSPNNFTHLPLVDQIETLGYNRVSFVRVKPDDLIYYRPGQIVARELLILTRK